MSLNLLLVLVIYAIGLMAALRFGGHRSVSIAPATGSRNRPERILIIGATGRTGRQLVAQALERGFAVTAFARDPSQLPALIRVGREAETAFHALRRGRDLLGPGIGRLDLG